MADTGSGNTKGKVSPENDPILQGVDRVQNIEQVDAKLVPEIQEGAEDTHTRTNIHLGGRDDEGIGTGPRKDEGDPQPQNLNSPDLGSRAFPIPDGGPIDPSGRGFSPAKAIEPNDPNFSSSGRATPEVDINNTEDGRPTIEPFSGTGVSTPNFAAFSVLSDEIPPEALIPDDGIPDEEEPPANVAPTSDDNSVVTDEDTDYTFSITDFVFSDADGDSFDHITIVDLPLEGKLVFNGIDVGAGDEIPADDIGLLVFTPDPDENGNDYATFNFTVNDGTNDSELQTISIDVNPINDPPTSEDNEVTTDEDTFYTFDVSDFAYNDIEGDAMDHITITELPVNGTLTLNGVNVVVGGNILTGDIGLLVFTPDPDENGDNYATFKFTVNDGALDSAEQTISIDVTPVNDAPVTADETVETAEDTDYTFKLADFEFSDVDGDSFDHLTIVDLPVEGKLFYNGSELLAGDFDIAPADIGLLVFRPDPDENGDNYATFNFTVNDGTVDSVAETITVDVTPVNDAPTVSDNETTILEDSSHTFEIGDFTNNYADIDGDAVVSVTITELPVDGTLTFNGNPVTLNDPIAVGDIGGLVFVPDLNESGDDYANLKFTVSDGTDDSAEHTYTIDVTAVADNPHLCILTEKIDGSALYDISQGGEVNINVEYFAVEAGYENSHGFYIADVDGNPIGGVVVKDNVKELGTEDIVFNTADYPGGVTLGFFIIPDGDTQNAALESGDAITFQNIGGVWTPFLNGVALGGAQQSPAYFSDASLNPDNFDHFDDTGLAGNQNWEDLWNGGDRDNSDVNAFVTLTICSDATVHGPEETPIALPEILSTLTDVDGSEDLMVTIAAIPDGVEISDGNGNTFTATPGNNSVDVTGWNLDNLSVIAPVGSEDFDLTVEAKATESSNNDTAISTGTITVDIIHAPTTADETVTTVEDTTYTFEVADFVFNDIDGDNAAFVTITTLPSNGVLKIGADDVVIGDNNEIAIANIDNLVFIPDENESGDSYTAFNFTVTDDGVIPLTSEAQTLTIDVTPQADSPEVSLEIGEPEAVIEVVPTEINIGNVLDTGNGYTVTARVVNNDGTLSDALAANVSVQAEGIGVTGINDGPDDQIGFVEGQNLSEELIITLDEDVTSMDVTVSFLFTQDVGQTEDEIGYYTLYNDDVQVGNGTIDAVDGGVETAINIAAGGTNFDQIIFTTDRDLTNGQEGHSDYFVNLVTFDSPSGETTAYMYPLSITAALTDTDGSEILSDVTLSGVPVIATFIDGADNQVGTNNNDGSWSFTQAELSGLKMSVPDGAAEFDLTVSATATETLNSDFETSSTTLHVITGDEDSNVIAGTASNDYINAGNGDDTVTSGAGNDTIFGGLGDDEFIFAANEGQKAVDGGLGASWTDTIALDGFDGLNHEVGWTLTLEPGSLVQSTDDAAGEMILSQDADGTITFDDGGSLNFTNVEKIVW